MAAGREIARPHVTMAGPAPIVSQQALRVEGAAPDGSLPSTPSSAGRSRGSGDSPPDKKKRPRFGLRRCDGRVSHLPGFAWSGDEMEYME